MVEMSIEDVDNNLFVRSLSIENFKGFDKQEFVFHDRFTAIVGDNGYGKTSILDALTVAIGVRQLSLSGGQKYQRPILKDTEVRVLGTEYGSFEKQLPCKAIVSLGDGTRVGRCINDETKAEVYYSRASLKNDFKMLFSKVRKGEPVDLPLMAYHSVYRLMELDDRIVKKTKIKNSTQGSRLEGYDDCFSAKSSSKYFLSWYKTMQENSINEESDSLFLQLFNKSLLSCLDEWEKVYYSPKVDDFVLVHKVSHEKVQLHMMSTGYRTMTGLVADLVYRCIKLNPHLKEDAISKTRGIVLIDEIDLHLHPIWQKRIVKELMNCFKSMQFVVTTHSPFILQSLRSNQIINLEREKPDWDPNMRSLETSALYMGVDDVNGTEFSEKEKAAIEYLTAVKNKKGHGYDAEIDSLFKKYASKYSSDPFFVAQLKLEGFDNLADYRS